MTLARITGVEVNPIETPVLYEGKWWTSTEYAEYQRMVERSGLNTIVTEDDIDWLYRRNTKHPPTITIRDKVVGAGQTLGKIGQNYE